MRLLYAIATALLSACSVPVTELATGEIEAIVRFEPVEGGCWALDIPGKPSVQPLDLPAAFKIDGKHVVVTLEDAPGLFSVCQVGTLKYVRTIRAR